MASACRLGGRPAAHTPPAARPILYVERRASGGRPKLPKSSLSFSTPTIDGDAGRTEEEEGIFLIFLSCKAADLIRSILTFVLVGNGPLDVSRISKR